MKTIILPASRRPISRKAYKGFLDLIISVLGNTPQAAYMKVALDLYLSGVDGYDAGLDESLRIAFAYLRQSIDAAMERSRKVRERVAMRRAKKAAETTLSTDADTDDRGDVKNTASGAKPFHPQMPQSPAGRPSQRLSASRSSTCSTGSGMLRSVR